MPLGLSFGSVADVYERVRPGYGDEALERATAELELHPGATVVDLAAGTGKLTRALAPRFANVIAIEPDERMRALNAGSVAGSAEAMPLADASVDAVFVGDAFHWFDAPVALAEIARVLRPRGGLALVWNHWFETVPPIPEGALALLNEPWERSNHAVESNRAWRDAFGPPFEPLRETTYHGDRVVDRETLVDLYATTSSFAALPEEEHRELKERLRSVLEEEYVLPIETTLAWTRLA